MKLSQLEHRVVLERLVIGLEEPILVKGAGPMTAKVDSGNGGYNVIHGEDLVLQGAELSFKTVTDNGERRMQATVVDTISVNIGSGNIQERPVIELDVKFAGEDYKRVRFSVADRAANSEKVLISKDFIADELDALIDVGASNISNDNVQAELVTESDGGGLWQKTKTAASTITSPVTAPLKAVGGFISGAGDKMQSFSRWCDNFAHGRGGWDEIFKTATGKVVLGALAAGSLVSNPTGMFLLGAALAKGITDFAGYKGWVSTFAAERDTEMKDRDAVATRLSARRELWSRLLVSQGIASGDEGAASLVENFSFKRVATFSADTDAHGGKPQQKVFPDFYKERWREMSALAKKLKAKNEAFERQGRLLLESMVTESAYSVNRDDFLKKSSQDIYASVKAKAESEAKAAGRSGVEDMYRRLTNGGADDTQPLLAELVNGDLAGKLKAEEEGRAAGQLGEFSALCLSYLNGPSPDVRAAVNRVDKAIESGQAQKYGNETRAMVENCDWLSVYLVDLAHNRRVLDDAYDAAQPFLFQSLSNVLSVKITTQTLRSGLGGAAREVQRKADADDAYGPCCAFFVVAQGSGDQRSVTLLEPTIANDGTPEGGAAVLKGGAVDQPKPGPAAVLAVLDGLDPDALMMKAASAFDYGAAGGGTATIAVLDGVDDIDSILTSAADAILKGGAAQYTSALADFGGVGDASDMLADAAGRVLAEEDWQDNVDAAKPYADLSGISPFTGIDWLLM